MQVFENTLVFVFKKRTPSKKLADFFSRKLVGKTIWFFKLIGIVMVNQLKKAVELFQLGLIA